MGVVLIFKIGAIGLAVAVLHQVLARSGREEYALLTTMAGVLVVVMMFGQILLCLWTCVFPLVKLS